MNPDIAPLWMPFAALAAIVAWVYVWHHVVTFLSDLNSAALSMALMLPALFMAAIGFLGIGAVFVASVVSILGLPL